MNYATVPLREKVDCVADARRMRGLFHDEAELVEPYPSPSASLLPLPQGGREEKENFEVGLTDGGGVHRNDSVYYPPGILGSR